jgi:hypothetical protein
VVQARAALRQKSLQASCVWPAGAHNSSEPRRAARVQKCDVGLLPGHVLARAGREPEEARELTGRGVPIGDGDGDVVDALDLDHGERGNTAKSLN